MDVKHSLSGNILNQPLKTLFFNPCRFPLSLNLNQCQLPKFFSSPRSDNPRENPPSLNRFILDPVLSSVHCAVGSTSCRSTIATSLMFYAASFHLNAHLSGIFQFWVAKSSISRRFANSTPCMRNWWVCAFEPSAISWITAVKTFNNIAEQLLIATIDSDQLAAKRDLMC